MLVLRPSTAHVCKPCRLQISNFTHEMRVCRHTVNDIRGCGRIFGLGSKNPRIQERTGSFGRCPCPDFSGRFCAENRYLWVNCWRRVVGVGRVLDPYGVWTARQPRTPAATDPKCRILSTCRRACRYAPAGPAGRMLPGPGSKNPRIREGWPGRLVCCAPPPPLCRRFTVVRCQAGVAVAAVERRGGG